MIAPHEGWRGMFTRDRANGAYPSGQRIVKVKTEAGDANPIGTRGTVLGSVGHPDLGICYFIEWDNHPRAAVAVIAWKIATIKEGRP
jgi:hypothetical protein